MDISALLAEYLLQQTILMYPSIGFLLGDVWEEYLKCRCQEVDYLADILKYEKEVLVNR